MKKYLFTFVFFLLCTSNIFATAQYPDKIIYGGKEYDLHSNPLEPYFEKFPDSRPENGIRSSGLWRGYVATFEFLDKSLVLKDIQIEVRKKNVQEPFETEWKSVIDEVLPNKKKLKIDWFTGILVIPYGEIVKYVEMGYGSTYENYILLEVEKGVLNKSKEFDYKEYEKFKQRQFDEFKKTEEYKKLVEQFRKTENTSLEFIDSFLKDFITNYTSKLLVD